MQETDACLESIERAMSVATSPLARALRDLVRLTGGRGTCLLIEHDEMGETLIADRRWAWDRTETLRNRDHFTLVDLRQDDGFRRFAVLIEPSGTEDMLDETGLHLTLAALGVTHALAEIAATFSGTRPVLGETGAKPPSQLL